jgi:hypothetical protein
MNDEKYNRLLEQMDSEIEDNKLQLLNSIAYSLMMEFNDYNKIKNEIPSEQLARFQKNVLDRVFKKLNKAGIKFE